MRVPTNVPLVHLVVGVVSCVDIAVVHVRIVNTIHGVRTTRTGGVGGRAKVGTGDRIDAHDGGRVVGHVLVGITEDMNF